MDDSSDPPVARLAHNNIEILAKLPQCASDLSVVFGLFILERVVHVRPIAVNAEPAFAPAFGGACDGFLHEGGELFRVAIELVGHAIPLCA